MLYLVQSHINLIFEYNNDHTSHHFPVNMMHHNQVILTRPAATMKFPVKVNKMNVIHEYSIYKASYIVGAQWA